jgi:transcriptional regulator with XRE-family HTH domain
MPDDAIMRDVKELGRNLRRVRVNRGITQEQLSEAVNLNIRTLQRIEAGQCNILTTTVIRLIRALGCTSEELLPLDRNASPSHNADEVDA